MRPKTKEMLNRIYTLLAENEYMSAQGIAEAVHLSNGSIYRAIRILREQGTGILVTNKGYILAECAKKRDDVNFLRRLNGRRTSDTISLIAAEPHIKKRWNAVKDRRILGQIIAPLRGDKLALFDGMSKIRLVEKKQGVGKVQ